MRSLSTAGLLALTSLLPLAPLPTVKAEGDKKAPQALQGEWRITRSGADGELRELLEKNSKVVIKGTKVTVLAKADVKKEVKLCELTVKLAPGKKPKEIDLKVESVIPVAGVESIDGDVAEHVGAADEGAAGQHQREPGAAGDEVELQS